MNIQDAIDVIESVSGFTDESTPVGEAWLEVLSFISCRPTTQPEAVAPTDEELRAFYDSEDNDEYEWPWWHRIFRVLLARYGTPTIQPVPVPAPTNTINQEDYDRG